jgi:divalent metal cation (Fe/Co/Zn/Cd) transporter
MERHPADVFSLVAGLMTLGLGLLLLSGGLSDVPMEWVGPAVAIGIGILIVVAARPGRDQDEDPAPPQDVA